MAVNPVVVGTGAGVVAGGILSIHTGQGLVSGALIVALGGAAGMVIGTLFLPTY